MTVPGDRRGVARAGSRPDAPARRPAASGRPRRLLPWLTIGAAALVLAAVAAVGVLAAPDRRPAVLDETFVTDAGPEGRVKANTSPTAVSNPTDPGNVVVVHRVDAPHFDAVLHWSADAGRSWSTTALPLPAGTGRPDGAPIELGPDGEIRFVETQRPFAPDVAFAPDGRLYVVYTNLMGQGNVPDNLWLATSEDGGATLSEPVRVAGDRVYQARVAVGHDGVVHITYLQATDIAVWALAGPAPIVATRSADGGRTFTAPVRVSDPDRPRVGAAVPAVTADGDLAVLYHDYKDNVRDFRNLEGPPWSEPGALVVTRSEDGGASFSAGREIDDGVVPGERFIVFLPPSPALAAAPDGALYAAWADAREGDRDVYLRRSPDGGRTWGPRRRVNDNPADDGTSQYLPAVAAGHGRVDVVYLDRRVDPDDVQARVSLATSLDGGATFDTIALSSESFDSTVGPETIEAHVEPGLGSRLGLVTWADSGLGVWTDTRLDPEFNRQDIVAARVRLPDAAALAARRRVLVQGPLAGLAVLGVVALLLALRRRGTRRP